jgi:chitinase
VTDINMYSVAVQADAAPYWAPANTDRATFDAVASDLVVRAHQHDVRVFLGMVGNFRAVASDPTVLSAMVDNVQEYASKMRFDGIDIDWEFPEDDGDAALALNLLNGFRNALDQWPTRGMLSVEIRYEGDSINWPLQGYTVDTLKIADNLNVMCYDLNWIDWDGKAPATWVAPLYSPGQPCVGDTMDGSCRAWLKSGLDTTKMALGVPFYGARFNGISEPCGSGYTWQAYSLGEWEPYLNAGTTEHWDSNSHGPWFASSDSDGPFVVLYENPQSIAEKAAWARDTQVGGKAFGGMMMWTMGMGRATPTSEQLMLESLAGEYWK